MRSLKSVFGVIGSIVSVVYCGYLFYYFYDTAGSLQEAEQMGLAPTLLELGAVGLFFALVLFVKIFLIVGAARTTRAGRRDTPDDGFDADAVVARYKARQSTEIDRGPSSPPPSPPPAPRSNGSANRPSFGRKVR